MGRSNAVNLADQLFFDLDGRLIEARDDEWRVEVCGVHSSTQQHWVQVNVVGPVACGLTLRTESLDASDILDRLSGWIEQSMPSDEASLFATVD